MGVFRHPELVAAARLCVLANLAELPEAVCFRSLDAGSRGSFAFMSHGIVDPRLHELRLDDALDAARIERARQLRHGVVLAVAESPRRIAALEAQGFQALELSADGRRGLVLHLARARRESPVTRPVPSRR